MVGQFYQWSIYPTGEKDFPPPPETCKEGLIFNHVERRKMKRISIILLLLLAGCGNAEPYRHGDCPSGQYWSESAGECKEWPKAMEKLPTDKETV